MHNINKSELVSKILINVLLISIFIAIFFFTYGSYIEGKIVKDQMKFLSTDIKNVLNLFGENANNVIIEKIKMPDLSHEDKKAEENNKEIKIKAFKFLSFFSLFIVGIVYMIYIKNKSYELNKIISENLVILIGVGLTEYVFLTYFAARFISIDPNQLKLTVLGLFK